MKIYFNGDSHTSGSELKPNQAYSYQLANLLDAEIIGNPAIGGASNDRILRTTERDIQKWIETGERPDLVVIGWSEFVRFDWFISGDYKTVNSEELPYQDCLAIDTNRHRYIQQIMAQPAAISFYTRLYHDKIYNLHQHLDYLAIPHLFFSAVIGFKPSLFNDLHKHISMETMSTGDPVNLFEYRWNNSYLNPYTNKDSSFLEWGTNKGYKVTEHFHLEADAHTEYATILKSHLLGNSIISL